MNKETLIKELKNLNITLTEEQLLQFETYKNLLQEYNKKFNLTSLTSDSDIYLKHFYDSLCITKVDLKDKNTILDIGSGAGFPGIPLSILYSDKKITLIEANTKKCNFLNIVKDKLNLNNLEIINTRAETFAKQTREYFDVVTSRAVSHLKILLELEIPTLKVNGLFIPLKGDIEIELQESKDILKKLNCTLKEIIKYSLPIENSKRTIPIIIKNSITPLTYPREYNKIKNS